MKLVFPSLLYKEKAIQFINEFYEYNSEINGSGALDGYLENSTYEEWLQKVVTDIDIANIVKPRVPALTYFYVREEDDKIIGMINIRLALNDFLRKEGGHIGYCIRPTERQKHYATDMLNEALKVCDTLGIKEVILSCDKSNVASAKVIKNCKGELDAEFYSETFKEVIQKYIVKREKEMNLRLRPYKPCDAENIVSWIKDEDALRKWSSDRFGDFPITSDDINDKYLNNNGDCIESDNFYPMTAFDDSGVIGHLILRYTDEKKKVIRFGFVIVDDSKRGKGYGKKMLTLAMKYAFDILGAEKITLGVFDNNESAYFCYKAAGFVENGEEMFCELFGKQWRIVEMEIKK